MAEAGEDPQEKAHRLGPDSANTQLIQAVLRDPAWAAKLTEEDRRGLSPLFWSHVNPYGRFRLDMDRRLDLTAALGPGRWWR
jgi:hypothetical protein